MLILSSSLQEIAIIWVHVSVLLFLLSGAVTAFSVLRQCSQCCNSGFGAAAALVVPHVREHGSMETSFSRCAAIACSVLQPRLRCWDRWFSAGTAVCDTSPFFISYHRVRQQLSQCCASISSDATEFSVRRQLFVTVLSFSFATFSRQEGDRGWGRWT